MSYGVILTSIYPPRFFDACVFSSKISNYCMFRFNFLRNSFDNLGFVVKDYDSLLKCFSRVSSKFSLALSVSGAHFVGSLSGTQYEKGLIFDENKNYFTHSNSFQYQGYIRNIQVDITYFGGLRNKLPNGPGMILIGSKPLLIGNFVNGFPCGSGYYFSSNEQLEFFGSFYSRPLYGVYSKNSQYYEGIFKPITQPSEKGVEFEKKPIMLNNLKQYLMLHQQFQDFLVRGVCRHYSQKIHEISGQLAFGSDQMTGRFVVKYTNGSTYIGMLEKGARQGMGYFESPEGSFKLFGVFNGDFSVKGYLLIQHAADSSLKSKNDENMLLPQMIFGDIVYDATGKLLVKGMAKVIFTNGYVYYGQFIKNSITGYGKLYKKDAEHSVYTGQIYYGKQFGLGQLKTQSYVYEGEFSNDQFHGYGKLQKQGVTVKGFWQNGSCQYANLHFEASHRIVAFNSMYIRFDRPTTHFDLHALEGVVELYFVKNAGHTLADVYDGINSEQHQGEVKLVSRNQERKGSMSPKHVQRFQSNNKKRKMTTNPRDASIMSMKAKRTKIFEKNRLLSPQHNSSLKRLEMQPCLPNDPLQLEQGDLKQKPYKISGYTFQKLQSKNKSRLNVNISRNVPSANNLMMFDMEEQYDKIYSFSGRCHRHHDGKFIGEVRKHDEVFGVIETDKRFAYGVGLYKNSEGDEEILGSLSHFRISGEGMRVTSTTKWIGQFKSDQPEGLIIKSRPPKEDYIGNFRAGKKHEYGIKVSKGEKGQKITFLFNFWHGELRSLAKLSYEEEKSPGLYINFA